MYACGGIVKQERNVSLKLRVRGDKMQLIGDCWKGELVI